MPRKLFITSSSSLPKRKQKPTPPRRMSYDVVLGLIAHGRCYLREFCRIISSAPGAQFLNIITAPFKTLICNYRPISPFSRESRGTREVWLLCAFNSILPFPSPHRSSSLRCAEHLLSVPDKLRGSEMSFSLGTTIKTVPSPNPPTSSVVPICPCSWVG